MADSAAFEWLCRELEAATSLGQPEARGTVRITLREAGLKTTTVTPEQVSVVLRRVLPGELGSLGVGDAESVCESLATRTSEIVASSAEAPEAMFNRLAG